MPGFLGLQRFFGGTVSNTAAYSAGGAIQRVLHPQLQSLANEGWQLHPDYPLDAGVLANGVAQGQAPYDFAQVEATRTGINKERFDHLIAIANTGPGIPPAFDLWRRKIIDETGFRRAAKRQGLEQEWIDDLVQTFYEPLDPADLARGIHRGLVPDPGLLKGTANPGPGKVESYPQYDVDALAEAQIAGFDRDHLGVLVGLQGNPMGAHEAAQAAFRGVIESNDYLRAIAEGNTRNEWAEAIFEQSRQIPTVTQMMENALRGHHELAWALQQAARHGMTQEDAFVLWQNQGRPLNLHQITQGLAWGAKYRPGQGDDPDPWMQAVLLGPVRPEYYELQHSLKYTLPSALYFRTLQQSGVLSEDQAKVWYRRLGWPPELADQVAHAYATKKAASVKEATAADLLALYDGGRATAAETLAALGDLDYPADEARRKLDVVDARRVASAKQAAIGDLHTKYKKGELPDANVTTALLALGVADWAAPKIVAAWRVFLTAEAETAPTQLAPHLSGFTPANGPVGTTVTLTGTNLQGTSAVSLGGTTAQFTVTSPTVVSATVPAGATSGQWSVRTPGGAAASDASFLVT